MKAVYFLQGYAILRFAREYAEQVLNLCMRYGVVYLDGGSDSEYLRLCLRTGHAKRLCVQAEHRGIAFEVEKKGGVPQLFRRLLARPGLIAGALCALCVIVASECFVFDIRVTGNQTLTSSEVKQLLQQEGFGLGTFIPGVDTDRLENRVMLNSDRIAWLSVNIRGNVANVELVEQRLPNPIPALLPAHVVAARSGEVVAVEMYRGNVLVSAGQQVQKGEILIAGVYDSQTLGFRFTRASGKVLARTVHEFEVFVPYEYEKKVYTGEILEKKSIFFFSFPIKVFESTGNWGMVCDKIDIVDNFSLWAKVDLPLYVHTERYLPYQTERATHSSEAALLLAHREMNEKLAHLLQEGELLDKRIDTEIGDEGVTLRATVTCIVDIAAQQEFALDLKDKN